MILERRLLIGLGLALLATIALLTVVWVKLSGDEHAACVIQQRELPAGYYLGQAMGDLHTLVSFPPTLAQRRQQAEIPPKRLKQELNAYHRLNADTAAYFKLAAKQPRSRQC